MQDEIYHVLLVEDNPDDAEVIQDSLALSQPYRYETAIVNRLADAIKIIDHIAFDVILLDLSLPDSFGLESFTRLREQVQDTPIIILTGFKDEATAIQSVQSGAQDYIVKDFSDPTLLTRSIRFAIERQKHWAALQSMVLTDELTGLYNRRGFWTLSGQLFRMLKRSSDKGFVLYVDVDNMKSINDTYGHAAGDRAISMTAQLLQKTFRESDILARIGGDEFAVAAAVTKDLEQATILSRLQLCIDRMNQEQNLPFQLGLSIGIVSVEDYPDEEIDRILDRADRAMYKNKQCKNKQSN